MRGDKLRMTIDIDDNLHRQLKILSVTSKISIKNLVTDAIKEKYGLEDEENETINK